MFSDCWKLLELTSRTTFVDAIPSNPRQALPRQFTKRGSLTDHTPCNDDIVPLFCPTCQTTRDFIRNPPTLRSQLISADLRMRDRKPGSAVGNKALQRRFRPIITRHASFSEFCPPLQTVRRKQRARCRRPLATVHGVVFYISIVRIADAPGPDRRRGLPAGPSAAGCDLK